MFLNNEIKEKFFNNFPLQSFIEDKNNECWPWLGTCSKDGYGRFQIGATSYRAHRLAYKFFNGAIPKGKIIMHTCDNPICVNPKHLILGSQLDNMIDCCVKERIHKMKLNSEAVKVIKWSLKYNYKYGLISLLARLYKVKHSTIISIKNNKSWKHIQV